MTSLKQGRWYGCLKIGAYTLIFLGIVGILLALLALYLGALFFTTPQRNQYIGTLNRPHEDVTFTTSDNVRISAWYVPGTQPNAVILVHGIHANRAYLIPQAEVLAEAGYHVLLLDLRGHGYSEGNMLTYGYREALDVQAAVDYLLAKPTIKHVGALGHSLGGAAVVRAAAADKRLQAIVIQSSYNSLASASDESFSKFTMLPKWLAPWLITLAEYRTGVKIRQVNSARDLVAMPARPVLIIHSLDDNLFPVRNAGDMYRAAQEPKSVWLVKGLPHINPVTGHEAEVKQVILKFFGDAFPSN